MTKTINVIHDTIIIRDTIYKTIQKVAESKGNDAEIYKQILENQTQTYNIILFVFLGLIALFGGATYLYNTKLAKAQITKQTDKIFEREKEKILGNIKGDLNEEFYRIKGESARLFANQCTSTTPNTKVQLFYWSCQCIKYYRLCKNGGKAVRVSCKRAIKAGEYLKINKTTCKQVLLTKHADLNQTFYDIFATLPNELIDEKNKLKELVDDIVS